MATTTFEKMQANCASFKRFGLDKNMFDGDVSLWKLYGRLTVTPDT